MSKLELYIVESKKVLVSGTENKINQKGNTNEQIKNRSWAVSESGTKTKKPIKGNEVNARSQ